MLASKLRFSAAWMFYFVTLCAAATALFGWLGVPIGCFVTLIWVQLFVGARREWVAEAQGPPADKRPGPIRQNDPAGNPRAGNPRAGASKLDALVVLLIGGLVVGLLIPAAPDYEPQQQADTSMRLVAQAVEAYHQHFGRPVPERIVADDGTPWHSWRVLILPFLGEEKLAAAYRWDEPWNGPHNSQLAQYRPWHYRTYYPHSQEQRTTTALHLLTAPDGLRYVVEHEQAESSWLQPTQLSGWQPFAELPSQEHGFWNHGFFVSTYHGRLAVNCQQSVHLHPATGDGRELSQAWPTPQAAAISVSPSLADTHAGSPAARRAQLGQVFYHVHWERPLRLAFFLLLALLPLRWLPRKPPSVD